ncbi:Uncharacterized protein BM_BM5281 [Brugia malayi]|uniref:Bm5281 n=1 Tax=Brugia malayi TaxID=6279 RepID=A0A0J9Y0F4_BRUMA|nr:Uncharacterized protein BM_BM5281 [Brugia malayi]CDP99229.1 Bm5281 [Brugia malayi]VIO91162.1 Uncharacterized protein BM_BM5281 [Brugia malayi]
MILKLILLVWMLCCCLWYQTIRSQQVNVTIFTESKCKYCTKLLREQIWPFYVKRPGIMNIQIIPFGKGYCDHFSNQTFYCHCQHEQDECDLNRLQNCAIAFFPRRYLGLVTCVQGLPNIYEAFSRCLTGLTEYTRYRLIECATTQTGEVLNYYSMLNTHQAGIKLWPAMFVNGEYFERNYPCEIEICRHTTWC